MFPSQDTVYKESAGSRQGSSSPPANAQEVGFGWYSWYMLSAGVPAKRVLAKPCSCSSTRSCHVGWEVKEVMICMMGMAIGATVVTIMIDSSRPSRLRGVCRRYITRGPLHLQECRCDFSKPTR